MTSLLRAELLKLRTLRSTWAVGAVAVALSGTIGVAVTHVADASAPGLRDLVLAPAQPLHFLVVLLAVVAAAGEFQHHTVRTTLLAAPRRGRVLAAKAAVSAVVGAAVSLAGSAVAVAAGLASMSFAGDPLPGPSLRALGALVGVAALGAVWAVVGTGLGVLTRSTAAAVTAVLLWRFVGEGLVPVVTRSPGMSRWTPSGAGNALMGNGDHLLGVLPASLLLGGYAAAVVGAAATLFVRRDPA